MEASRSVTPRLSVVIPVFNESGNLAPLIGEIEAALADVGPFEVIVVDDGSSDGTAMELGPLMADRAWLRIERHGHRRGQSAAIWTGVQAALAPMVAVMDGDGQNDPADIPRLLAALRDSGAAMITGHRIERRDSWLRRISSRLANGIRSSILHDGVPDTGCGLKVFGRGHFLALPRFDHMHRFLPALFRREGGDIRSLPVNHRPRRRGSSKYGIRNRLWVGFVDLMGVMWLERRRF